MVVASKRMMQGSRVSVNFMLDQGPGANRYCRDKIWLAAGQGYCLRDCPNPTFVTSLYILLSSLPAMTSALWPNLVRPAQSKSGRDRESVRLWQNWLANTVRDIAFLAAVILTFCFYPHPISFSRRFPPQHPHYDQIWRIPQKEQEK